MAELPAKLDDGEVCLPEEKTIKPGEEAEEELFPSELTYMEELAQQLSAYALREQQQQTQTKPNNQTNPPTPNLQVKPLIRIGSSEGIEGNVRGTGVVHSVYASDQGGYRVELTPGYHLPPMKPVTAARGESYFIQASRGSRVYQKQQNQSRNRFLPFQTNESGFVRGTGVFFPRVEATPTEGGRKQGLNGNNKSSVVGKKEVVVVGLKATTEMGLPQEWTY